jgi:hypothetical protein
VGTGVGCAGAGGHTGFSAGGQISGSGARATSRGGVGVAQPESNESNAAAKVAAAIVDNGRTRNVIGRDKVAWVFVEIIAVLAIAIGIVWWTLPKKPRSGEVSARKGPPDEGKR